MYFVMNKIIIQIHYFYELVLFVFWVGLLYRIFD